MTSPTPGAGRRPRTTAASRRRVEFLAAAEPFLTVPQFDVLLLSVAGMRIKHIALALEVSPAAVRGRLSRARERVASAGLVRP